MTGRELERPLCWVLMFSFDRHEVATLTFGHAAGEEISRWSASLYQVAAELVAASGSVRSRVASSLERRLQPYLRRHQEASLIELSAAFRAAVQAFAGRELAAILWILVERARPSATRLAQRLVREAEVAAARWMGNADADISHLHAPQGPEADRLSAIG